MTAQRDDTGVDTNRGADPVTDASRLAGLTPVRAVLTILASLLALLALSPHSRAFLHATTRSISSTIFPEGSFVAPAWHPAPTFLPDTLDAIVFVYRNPKAVLIMMERYKKAYPEGRLVLLCDDGCYDFTDAAKHFGHIFVGDPHVASTKTGADGTPNAPGHFLQPLQTIAVLDLLREALAFVRTRFVLYLETDVNVIRRVRDANFSFTLNGMLETGCSADGSSCDGPGNWFVGASPVYAHLFNPAFDPAKFPGMRPPYGGQGGSIFDAEFLRSVVHQPARQLDEDMQAYFGCSTTMGVDYFFSTLVYRYNGTIGPYAGYGNRLDVYHPGANPLAYDVVHPDKSAYDTALTEEELIILGSNYTFEHWLPRPLPPNHAPIHDVNDWPPCSPRDGIKYFMGDTGLDKSRWSREWWDAPESAGS